ncbi:MAG: paraslipin, partial [Okeania sp. SIO2D1]|nr:paraslipin [Okeania sp. SIO2D1]
MEQFFLLVFLALGGSGLAGSVKVINQGNEALVETLG